MRRTVYCVAFGCLNSNIDPNLTFFSLPRNPERRRKWLILIDRQDLLERENLKLHSHLVCSAHFEDSSIKLVKNLKDDALPTKLLPKEPKILPEEPELLPEEPELLPEEPELLPEEPEEGPSSSEPHSTSTSGRVKGKVTILKSRIVKEGPCASVVRYTRARVKEKRKVIIVSNIEKNAIGTQTEASRSTDKQTQTSKSLAEDAPRKRKKSNEKQDCELKHRKLDQEITKIKEVEAENQSLTCDTDDEMV